MNFGRALAVLFVIQVLFILNMIFVETNVISLDSGLARSLEIVVGIILLAFDFILLLVLGTEPQVGTDALYFVGFFIMQSIVIILLFFYSGSSLLGLILAGLLILTVLNIIILLVMPSESKPMGFFDYFKSFVAVKEQETRLEHRNMQQESRLERRNMEQKLDEAVEKVKESVDELKQVPVEEEKIRLVSKNGKNFHRLNCLALRRVSKENRKVFDDEKLAIKAGYKPCVICLPREK